MGSLPLFFMGTLLFIVSIFLMLLILVQRGKGGGLTGALGGMGGQSAFGSKAGDAFTKITIITSIIWITLCMLTIALFNPPPPAKQQLTAEERYKLQIQGEQVEAPETTGEPSTLVPGDDSQPPESGDTPDETSDDDGIDLTAPETNDGGDQDGEESSETGDDSTDDDEGNESSNESETEGDSTTSEGTESGTPDTGSESGSGG